MNYLAALLFSVGALSLAFDAGAKSKSVPVDPYESLQETMKEVALSRPSIVPGQRDDDCNGCVATVVQSWPFNYYYVSYVGDVPNQSVYSIHVVGDIDTYGTVNDCAAADIPCVTAVSTSTSSFSYLCIETLISGPPLSPGVATDAAEIGVKSSLGTQMDSVVTLVQLGTHVNINELTSTISCGDNHIYKVGLGNQLRVRKVRTTDCN
jgi:hypothetical protein